MEIKVRLERDEDGFWVATCPSLPGCISQGKTQKEVLKNIKEAIKLHISSLAEDSMPIFGAHKAKETVVEVTV